MKDKKLAKFVIILLALTMIVIMLVAGTYAKYTSTATGVDTVSVAKWSIKVGTTEIATATPQEIELDLFSSIKDSDGTAEANVAGVASGKSVTGGATAEDKLIAPGTSGSFSVSVENTSEVDATYSMSFVLTNASNIPLEFSTNGTTWVKPDAETGAIDVGVTDVALNMGATGTVPVQWRWAYTGAQSSQYTSTQNDTTDTTLGIAAQTTRPTATVTATIVATQVD